VVNNILANNGSVAKNAQMKIDAGATALIDANLFWSSNTSQQRYWDLCSCHAITRSVIKDPAFVNATDHNYHLQASSPAIGTGNTSYTQLVDHVGITRHLPPDLGAYSPTP